MQATKPMTTSLEEGIKTTVHEQLPGFLDILQKFVTIPNQSKAFDPEWETNGLLDNVVKMYIDWALAQGVRGLHLEKLKEPGRAPLIYGEIEPTDKSGKPGTILYYGHFDKQPPMSGWREGLSATKPVIEGDRLYGRGCADDGYAFFATILSILTLQRLDQAHPRCVLLFEGDEESGGGDLECYCDKLVERIGKPDILIPLDSGGLDYNQMWITNSLRGCVNVTVKIGILTAGSHSGYASGVVPSTFRIARMLLDRLENAQTGEISKEFHVDIPPDRYKEAFEASHGLGTDFFKLFPFVDGALPTDENVLNSYLNRTWKPQLSIIGQSGIPDSANAGNVLRASTTLTLSLRLPPTLEPEKAEETLKRLLLKDPPYNAKIEIVASRAAGGWTAPPLQPYLQRIIDEASSAYYQKPARYAGEGGSIPFLNYLAKKFPAAQFITTGVLGPDSNAHSINECMNIPYTEKLICCLSYIATKSTCHLGK